MLFSAPRPHLRTLVASGKLLGPKEPYLRQLVSVLEFARDLEEINVWLGPFPHEHLPFDVSTDIIRALPSCTKLITLTGHSVFPPSSLIDALESGFFRSLAAIKISSLVNDDTGTTDEVSRDKVEERCRARGIALRWCDTWGRE